MSGDGFFAIGPTEWAKACKLGINPAVALLVLARGTGRDNITTSWSATAVATHAGISWMRAKDAIAALEAAKLASVAKSGTRPSRKLVLPKDLGSALWLPNALVDGAGDEVPPVVRLRRTQKIDHLQAFVELYGEQDLAGDGGLSRNRMHAQFERERVGENGQFNVWGFRRSRERTCWETGPLARFKGKKVGEEWAVWDFIRSLERAHLLETVDYLAEGDGTDAELLHALTGDDEAIAVRDAAYELQCNSPEWLGYRAENYDYLLPVIRDYPAPAVVSVSRLVYRPHTSLTAAWWARHRDACQRFEAVYRSLARGDYRQAARGV